MPSTLLRPAVERARPLLGTRVAIRIEGLDEAAADRAIDAGFEQIALIHRLMSFHEPGSDLSRLNREAAGHAVTVHAETFDVLTRAQELAAWSDGAFDATVAGRLVEWGLLPAPPGAPAPDPAAAWQDVVLEPPDRVRFRRPLWLDLGGIAKGHAVDRALERMALGPAIQVCVEAGGDLRVAGPAAQRIRLRTLQHANDPVPVLELENGALASSSGRESDARHQGRRIGPHVNVHRQRSMGTRSFVSVVAERCVLADGLTKVVLARGSGAAGLLRRCGATAYLHTTRRGWRSIGMESNV